MVDFEKVIERLDFLVKEFVETSKKHQIDASNQSYQVLIEEKSDHYKEAFYSWGCELAYKRAARRLQDNIDYLKSSRGDNK